MYRIRNGVSLNERASVKINTFPVHTYKYSSQLSHIAMPIEQWSHVVWVMTQPRCGDGKGWVVESLML